MNWTESNAELYIETGREGALAAKGHNLRFSFESFDVSYNPESKEMVAVVKTESVTYQGVVESDGTLDPEGLSSGDQDKVTATTKNKILHVEKYHTARFEATIPDIKLKSAISGKLTLCGVTVPVTFEADIGEDYVSATFSIFQSEFEIKPYSAFLGALKVADEIKIFVKLKL